MASKRTCHFVSVTGRGLLNIVILVLDKDSYNEFQAEIGMMKKVGSHPNIVQMLGYVTKTSPNMLIMELILAGNLLKYLHRLRHMWTYRKDESSEER